MLAFLSYLFTVKMDAQILYLGSSRRSTGLAALALFPGSPPEQ